jgi:asparagine synthase (glutamine-hydrolysing)
LLSAIAYRGPDDQHVWRGDDAVLAHAALHTVPEARASRQPLSDESGKVTLVLDGYCSNWEEVRTELTANGLPLRDRSDAELLLKSYLLWGEDCPRHFDGEYAFAIWDGQRNIGFAARDHHGLRPFYYRAANGQLTIASEIPAVIAAAGIEPTRNVGFLAEIAAGEIYSNEETAWREVSRLPAAHSLRFAQGEISLEQYWKVPVQVSIRYSSDAEYAEHYREVLSECVRRSSRSELPLAAEVSGGLDSSATYAIAHQLLRQGRLPAPGIEGFTCVGVPGSVADEVAFARQAASHVDGTLQEVGLFAPDLNWFCAQSQRSGNVPTYTNAADSIELEQAMQAAGCRVALNGMGGDQWLDGGPLYLYESLRSGDWHGVSASFAADRKAHGWIWAASFAARQACVAILPEGLRAKLHALRHKGDNPMEPFWLSASARQMLAERRARAAARAPHGRLPKIKHAKHTNGQFQLAIDLMEHQRAHSHIEARSPMLSRAFIEFSAQTPEHIRRRGGMTKFVHREALHGILPPSILSRTSKAAFPAKPEISEQLQAFFAGKAYARDAADLFDPDALQALVTRRPDKDVGDYWDYFVWCAFSALALSTNENCAQ